MKDCCTKNIFTFNNVIYERIDGVSMGSYLGPTLANIITTESEIKLVDSLFKDDLLKFYIRCVDDTLTLIKESDIDNVLSKLNGFCPSLNFSVDKFNGGVVHYWDLKTIDKKTNIYYNNTHIGQYMHFSCYKPWNIYDRAMKIYSNQKLLDDQMKKTLSFISWNGFPNLVCKPLLHHSKSNRLSLKVQ